MKKIILFTLLLVCNLIFAQEFRLTVDGFVNADETSNNYIILEYPNKSKEELYKEVLFFATKNYRSAKDVVSKVENEVITINAYAEKSIRRNNLHVFDNNYTIVFFI